MAQSFFRYEAFNLSRSRMCKLFFANFTFIFLKKDSNLFQFKRKIKRAAFNEKLSNQAIKCKLVKMMQFLLSDKDIDVRMYSMSSQLFILENGEQRTLFFSSLNPHEKKVSNSLFTLILIHKVAGE